MQQRAPALNDMTVDTFLTWSMAQPEGRYELVDGEVVVMPGEGAAQNFVKLELAIILRQAVAAARLPCGVLTDGMTVRIDDRRAREPDAAVTLLRPTLKAIEIIDPVIVCEVLSPNFGMRDKVEKLSDYVRVPSVAHYLILDPDQRLVIHHARANHGGVVTRTVADGLLRLDPPGLDLAIEPIFAPLDDYAA